MKNTTFHFTTQAGRPAIEIRFADKSFLSCITGTDLADLDDLLQYFIPSLDLEQLTYANARYLEQELYHWLLGCQTRERAEKVFTNFCTEVTEKYAKLKRQGQPNKIDYLLQEMEWKLKQMFIAVRATTAPR